MVSHARSGGTRGDIGPVQRRTAPFRGFPGAVTLTTDGRQDRTRTRSRPAQPPRGTAARRPDVALRGERDRRGGDRPLGPRRPLPVEPSRSRARRDVHLELDRHRAGLLVLRADRGPLAARPAQRGERDRLRRARRRLVGDPHGDRRCLGVRGAVHLRRGDGLAGRDPVLDAGQRRVPRARGEEVVRSHRRRRDSRQRHLRLAGRPLRAGDRGAEPAAGDGCAARHLRRTRASGIENGRGRRPGLALAARPQSPLGLALGSGASAASATPGLFVSSLAKGSDTIFRYTINDASMQLLYVPVAPHVRGRAKAFIDGVLKPTSVAFAGAVLLFYKQSGGRGRPLTAAVLLLVGTWVWLLTRARGEYVRSLVESLERRRLDLSSSQLSRLNEGTMRALRTALGGEPATVLHALTLVRQLAQEADFTPELRSLLRHQDAAVRASALDQLGELRRPGPLIDMRGLQRDPVAEVRAAALGAVCAIEQEAAVAT